MRLAATFWLALALPSVAAPVDALVAATEQLDAAREVLEASLETERLEALTGVVQAFDTALAALREAERETAIARRAAAATLDARGGELSRVLAALQAAGAPTTAERILHPAGPLGAARAALLMASAAPGLESGASEARSALAEINALDSALEAAEEDLQAGARTARAARVALAARAQDAAPGASAETLAGLEMAAASLQELALALAESPAGAAISASPPPGGWSLPVRGTVLRRYMEPDAGGTPRPGLVIATQPQAILTAPAPMTVRFTGTLAGYGNVMILEPAPGYLLVLTGFGEALAQPGQVLPPAAPLALMAGTVASGGTPAPSAALTQTLYVETRVAGESADPAEWFAMDKD